MIIACPGLRLTAGNLCQATCVTNSGCGPNATCTSGLYCECNAGYLSRSVAGADGSNCFNYGLTPEPSSNNHASLQTDCVAVPSAIRGSSLYYSGAISRPVCIAPSFGITS